jgi:GNAT superfamily N-acetyltransferase
MIPAADIECLERSIVAAVAPQRVVEVGGWLAPLDDGPIGRAKSAVPLIHAADPDAIADIEQIYQAARLPPAFRLAETRGLAAVGDQLLSRGYVAKTPTLMKTGTATGLVALTDTPAEILEAPDAAWIGAFTGEGFDPVEGAARVRNLSRSPDALYAAVREGERTIAVGVVSFGHGWAGIHGMRTVADRRRQGLASRVLAALGQASARRGIDRVFLQVEEPNPARVLYRQAGFTQAWRYRYWAKP